MSSSRGLTGEAVPASLDIDESLHPNPLSKLVKLVSKENHEFIVPQSVAMVSGTIRAVLTSRAQWREKAGVMPTIQLETISAPVLEKVIEYLFYKVKYNNTPPPIPVFPIDLDSVVPLLLAANYLEA